MVATRSEVTTTSGMSGIGHQEEQNKELFRRLIEEGFNKRDFAVLEELVAPDMKEHQFFGPGHPAGVEGAKAIVTDLHTLFADFKLVIEDITAEGDKVWGRLSTTGINHGSFMGQPPTGKEISIDVIDICRFKDGKMVEHWGVPDRFRIMMQLGLLSRPGQDRPTT